MHRKPPPRIPGDQIGEHSNLKSQFCSGSEKKNTKRLKYKIEILRRKSLNFKSVLAFVGLFSSIVVATNPKYTFTRVEPHKSDQAHQAFCSGTGAGVLNILTYWFKPGIQISFQTDGDLSSRTFITSPEDSNKKQYTMFNRGSNCQTVDPTFGGHIFISLVIEDHPSTPGKCQVTKIATTSKLVACSTLPPATTTTDVENLVSMKIGSYDEVSAGDRAVFTKTNLFSSDYGFMYIIPSQTNAIITEQFFELMLIEGYTRVAKNYMNFLYPPSMLNLRKLYKEKDNKIFTGKDFLERNTHNSLRGFHLNPDPNYDFNHFRALVEHGFRSNIGKTIHLQFYMDKARLLTDNDVLYTKIKMKPYLVSGNLKKFNYKIKMRRETSNNKLFARVVRFDQNWVQQFSGPEIEIPNSDSTDWVHFGLSLGYGVLYYIDATNIKFRVIEHLHVWHQGTTYSQASQTTHADTITSLKDTGWNMFLSIEVSLEAYKDTAETTKWESNPFGVRVWNFYIGYGAYPAEMVSNPPSLPDNKCFSVGFIQNSCLAYAFLQSATDVNTRNSIYDGIGTRKATCKASECRYCFMGGKCMFSIGSANEDLYIDTVDFAETQIDGLEYDANVQDPKSQHVKFTNNLGRDYFVRCPLECILLFF